MQRSREIWAWKNSTTMHITSARFVSSVSLIRPLHCSLYGNCCRCTWNAREITDCLSWYKLTLSQCGVKHTDDKTNLSRRTAKPTKLYVHPQKTRIILRILIRNFAVNVQKLLVIGHRPTMSDQKADLSLPLANMSVL